VSEQETHQVHRESTKLYLEYLDKEMNIMGILSAFCVATVAFSLKELLEAIAPSPLRTIWDNGGWYIMTGSALILGAGAWFYGQRSNLAWNYGQISLKLTAPTITRTELYDWLADADAWDTWIPYRCGFFFLWAGLAGYGVAAIGFKYSWIANSTAIGVYIAVVLVLLAICWRCARILAANPYEDDPLTWESFFSFETKTKRNKSPRKKITLV
jgi:hypothetical protein